MSDIEITEGRPLVLKEGSSNRVEASKLAGADHFMSSRNMHMFLDMLLHLVARPVCAILL